MRIIDADRLKEVLERNFGHTYGADVLRQLIDIQPTVVDKPQGEWIEYKPEHGKCPFCGDTVDLYDGKYHRYCGECGAKMKGDTE